LNRRLVLLNVALLGLAAALVWMLRADWFGAQARERAVLSRQVEPKKLLAPPSPPLVKPVSPAEYLEVAGKMLFSKDRNPTVVIEAPPAKPEPPMPALPSYHGQMAIGEPVAFLSTPAGTQRSYHAGETIGDFTLLSFDRDTIEFEWHGKSVRRKVEELRPKEVAQAAPPRAAAAASPAASSPAGNAGPAQAVTALGAASSSTASTKTDNTSDDPMLGPVQSDGSRACVPSDTSPANTVHAGFRKNVNMTLLGALCNWEQVK
jgi:hypothetical protein